MKRKLGEVSYYNRFIIVVVCLTIATIALVFKIIKLTIIERSFLLAQGDARSIRIFEVPAYRGAILDRNGNPLAISTPVISVWADPRHIDLNHPELPQLAELLDTSVNSLTELIEKQTNREFVYLQRAVTPKIGEVIKALQMPAIHLKSEFRRYYPEGETTAHVLGFTNIDDQGQEGLELAYHKWLKGTSGQKRIVKDRFGYVIAELDEITKPKAGNDLSLTLDRKLQYVAYRELKQAVEDYKAHSGSVVIVEAKTGEILAMVNYPSFNPNNRYKNHTEYYRNRAVTDIFEPGSVAKAFSIAAALSSGAYDPETVIDTNPSWIEVAGNRIVDHEKNGLLTVAEILQRSSNVGVAKVVLSLPPELIISTLHNFGIGDLTDSGFPGESSGLLAYHALRRPFEIATLGFGYGMAVTTLQLAQAYAVFANEGQLQGVSLLLEQNKTPPRSVIKPEVAQQMLMMLESVVDRGTGQNAKVNGYRVAGKTGTSRVVGPEGYDKNRHIATFVGIAPVSNPKIVVSVVISEPKQKSYYGGSSAAPVFSRITTEVLKLLQVPPDEVE